MRNKLLYSLCLAILLTACSGSRYGYISRVKVKPAPAKTITQKTEKKKSVEAWFQDSSVKEAALQTESTTPLSIFDDTTSLGSGPAYKAAERLVKPELARAKPQTRKQALKEKIRDDPPVITKNRDAHRSFIFALLTVLTFILFILLIASIIATTAANGSSVIGALILVYFLAIAMGIGIMIFGILAFILGLRGLKQINRSEGALYTNAWEAWFGIIVGGLVILSVLLSLIR